MTPKKLDLTLIETGGGCNNVNAFFGSEIFADTFKDFQDKVAALQRENAVEIEDLIRKTDGSDFLKLYLGQIPPKSQEAKDILAVASKFFDHYRGPDNYSRLIERVNAKKSLKGLDSEKKDKHLHFVMLDLIDKASDLHQIINRSRRELDGKASGHSESLFRGLTATPKVAALELIGDAGDKHMPEDYSSLNKVPSVIKAQVRSGVYYRTPVNKRTEPFSRIEQNPLDLEQFNPREWVKIPFDVGGHLIDVFIHKSPGNREMEPGALNLLPIASLEKIENEKPSAIFIFGDPNAEKGDFGFYDDKENGMTIGSIPGMKEYGYFGYFKKPILTLHNKLAIENGELPLHCAANHFKVKFDNKSPDGRIVNIDVLADDMAKIRFESDTDEGGKDLVPFIYGTETGAFACLDGFDEQTRKHLANRQVGYNEDADSNSRVVVPVASHETVSKGHQLDILLYVNNFSLIRKDESTINTEISVDEFIKHVHKGERVAAGSTGSERGEIERTFWANPFPELIDSEGEIKDEELYEKFIEVENTFKNVATVLQTKGKFKIGLGCTQMMAGAGNSLEDIAETGYLPEYSAEKKKNDFSEEKAEKLRKLAEDRFEKEVGPQRHAEDQEKQILEIARQKRERLKSEDGVFPDEVGVTVAAIGDSRTGKSETTAAMCTKLGLQLTAA